jgi:hypothetical protein
VVSATGQRISKAALSFPMAKVSSKRGNGVEKFLTELEAQAVI